MERRNEAKASGRGSRARSRVRDPRGSAGAAVLAILIAGCATGAHHGTPAGTKAPLAADAAPPNASTLEKESRKTRGGDPTTAAVAKTAYPPWATAHFFSATPYTPKQIAVPPPAEGSAEDAADLATLRDWQAKRTPAQCEAGLRQAIPTFEETFLRTMKASGRGFPEYERLSPNAKAALQKLFDAVQHDVAFIIFDLKVYYGRLRPYLRTSELKPCIKPEASFAYPSGHAGFGAAGAELLTEFFPTQAKALREAGDYAGELRIIGGVHHPTDIVNGADVGRRVVEMLRTNLEFRAEVDTVKRLIAENRRARARTTFAPGTALEKAAGVGAVQ